MVAHFRDTSRTVCDVSASLGLGEGGVIETIRLATARASADFIAGMLAGALEPIARAAGIVGVHLLEGRPADSAGGSAEKALRSQPDEVADWVVLIEAVEAEAIRALRAGAGATPALAACGVAPHCRRGLYRLQFGLTHAA